MNMTVVHLGSERGWRGGEQQTAYLVEELTKLGINNILVVRKNSTLENYCMRHDFKYYTLEYKNSFDICSALKLKSICKKENASIIHMHASKAHSIGVLSSALGNKTPLVLSRRVDFIPKNNFLTNWKYNHHAIKSILGVSDKITEIMREYTRGGKPCKTVYSGIDLARIKPLGASENILRKEFNISADKLLIGNTAALADHKDYPSFIETIEELIVNNIPVHGFIIGAGELEQQLRALVRAKNLNHHITFTGFRKDINDILPCLDVFLMTSKEEGLGTSILDAFLAQVSVVATNAGGMPELVKHEYTGLVANVGDYSTLAKHIIRLRESPLLKQNLINNAAEFVKNFSKEKTAANTLSVYKSILSNYQ